MARALGAVACRTAPAPARRHWFSIARARSSTSQWSLPGRAREGARAPAASARRARPARGRARGSAGRSRPRARSRRSRRLRDDHLLAGRDARRLAEDAAAARAEIDVEEVDLAVDGLDLAARARSARWCCRRARRRGPLGDRAGRGCATRERARASSRRRRRSRRRAACAQGISAAPRGAGTRTSRAARPARRRAPRPRARAARGARGSPPGRRSRSICDERARRTDGGRCRRVASGTRSDRCRCGGSRRRSPCGPSSRAARRG